MKAVLVLLVKWFMNYPLSEMPVSWKLYISYYNNFSKFLHSILTLNLKTQFKLYILITFCSEENNLTRGALFCYSEVKTILTVFIYLKENRRMVWEDRCINNGVMLNQILVILPHFEIDSEINLLTLKVGNFCFFTYWFIYLFFYFRDFWKMKGKMLCWQL